MANKKELLHHTPTILVTGGAGFIGSHTAVELLEAGYHVVAADNFYNAKPAAVDAVRTITGKPFAFEKGDVADPAFVEHLFSTYPIDAVIHFAGYKAVGESVAKPLMYYRNNLDTTLTILEAMQRHQRKVFVFSSSATVYAYSKTMPLTESNPLGTSNPYGETKLMIEKILTDVSAADPSLSIVCLRYFNPVGAHSSYLLGEEPNGIPNNLMPYIVKVATGQLDHLNIFGDDYPTVDGTGVRDYIHVVDLAKAHLKALDYAFHREGIDRINIGTGHGTSVLQLVHAFEKATGITIPYQITARRPGDLPEVWADTSYAKKVLGFTAAKTIEDMCKDSYEFERRQAKH